MIGLIFWSILAGFLMGLEASVKTSSAWKKILEQ